MKTIHSFALLLILLSFSSLNSVAQDWDENDDTPLMKAVKANNLIEVKKLVNAGAIVNEDTNNGWDDAPVDIAVLKNYKTIALFLLEKGATSRKHFYTAIESGDLAYVKTLLEYGYNDDEAVLAAVESKNPALVDFFVGRGYKVNFSQKRRTGLFRKEYVSPLDAALTIRNSTMVLILVNGGAPLDEAFRGACYFTDLNLGYQLLAKKMQLDVLHYIAVEEKNLALAKRALSLGANPNFISKDGYNVLHIAVKSGNKEALLYAQNECKLDFATKTSLGANSWMLAASSGNLELLTELIELPSFKLEDTDRDGETILFYAAESGNEELLKLILSKKPNVNVQNKSGVTAPMKLLWNQHYSRFVIFKNEGGINYTLTSNDGVDLLGYYLVSGAVTFDGIQEFVALGCDPKRLDKYGKNVAYHAVQLNNLELLKQLKSWGASVDPQNKDGERPEDRTTSDIIQYILTNGGNIERLSETWDESYLETALKMQDIQLFSFLLRTGANPNRSTRWEKSIVFKCLEDEKVDYLKLLLQFKPNLQITDTWGKNALEIAIEKGYQPAANLLRQAGAKTKSEWAQYEIERSKEMASINGLVSAKNLGAIQSLIAKYPDIKLTDAQRKELIVPAIQQNNIAMIELLYNQGFASTDLVNFQQQNVLHICVIENKLDLLKLFINKGANVKGKDAYDKLPIDYAKEKEIKSFLKPLSK